MKFNTILKTANVLAILVLAVMFTQYANAETVEEYSELEIEAETAQLMEMFEDGEEVLSPEDRDVAHVAGEHINTAPAPFKDSAIERKLKNGKIQEFDGDKYMIVRRRKYKKEPKPAPIVKNYKGESHRNRVSILAGESPSGNLNCNSTSCSTEREAHLGLQYMRDFTEAVDYKDRSDFSVHGLIQVQTNESIYLGLGLGF